jgi:hypothetical protein
MGSGFLNRTFMLTPEYLGDLRLDPRQHPHGQPHLSAASGLVRLRDRLYVVADDELHLGVFDVPETWGARSGAMPLGQLVRLFEGGLAHDKAQRKLAKPDLETLAALPPVPGCPFGALLALGSGSRPTRQTGVLMALDAGGALSGRVAHVDLSGLYAPLRARFADLNIEGAFFVSGELRLLQRGNQRETRSACICFDWNQIAPWLAGRALQPPQPKAVQVIALGEIDGVHLSLTDGAALDQGAWAFCAVAENTADSFHDGPCAGSVVGVVEADGSLRCLHRLSGNPKVEGIAVQAGGPEMVLTLVTDADDPAKASQLLRLSL